MKKLLLLLVLALTAAGLYAKTTTIYHTSDTHGFYYPQKGVGGFAALAAVVRGGPSNYLLLDSGDFSNGTIEAKASKGLKSIELMNAVGYAASTIGNHEFDFGDAALMPMVQHAKFPILAANFYERSTDKLPPWIRPFQIYNVDGVKIAVIGLANHEPNKTYKYKKDVNELKKILPLVEAQKPDVVTVIIHNALADDKHGTLSTLSDIAKKFPGRVHIVFGGHAHHIVQNQTINGVLFTESGMYLQNVSKVTVETDDKTGKFKSAKSELIPLVVAKTGEDAQIKALAESLREPGMEEVVGSASANLSKNPVASGQWDSPLNNWVADVCRAYAGTEIFVHNVGGTRISLEKGPITQRVLVDMHPFDNMVTKMTVDGKFLKYLVKKSLLPRNLFTYSGMTVTFKEKKGRVTDLKLFVNGQPVENHKLYTLATNSYIAIGKTEGWPFNRIPNEQKTQVGDKSIRAIVEEAVRAQSPLAPTPTGRILKF